MYMSLLSRASSLSPAFSSCRARFCKSRIWMRAASRNLRESSKLPRLWCAREASSSCSTESGQEAGTGSASPITTGLEGRRTLASRISSLGAESSSSTSESGAVRSSTRVSTSSNRCSMRSIIACREWFSEEECIFSGLSLFGRITVPVNKFASLLVPLLPECFTVISPVVLPSKAFCRGDRLKSSPVPAPTVELSVAFPAIRGSPDLLIPISRSRSFTDSAIGLFL
mmetsp:Transcript_11316/g.25170  ORF Transcript_11316/g.25170 Transcript_11316/m.25170 type:complete len:227 (+) Transcript_11316:1414-2094(+)